MSGAVCPDSLVTFFFQLENLNGVVVGVHKPEFADAVTGVQRALEGSVTVGCGGREDFDYEVGSALDVVGGYDFPLIVRDEDDIGLDDVVVGEYDVERCDINATKFSVLNECPYEVIQRAN